MSRSQQTPHPFSRWFGYSLHCAPACVMPQSGQWEMALSLFEELCTGDNPALVPDLYTYNTVMTVFSRSGMLRRALGLLEEAKARGLSPDVVTYR